MDSIRSMEVCPCSPGTREADGPPESALCQLRLHRRLGPGKQGGARLGKATAAKHAGLTGPSGHTRGENNFEWLPPPELLLQNHKSV